MKKLIAVFCLSLVVLLATTPPAAQAGCANLWPNQFTISNYYHGSLAKSFEGASRSFYSIGAYGNVYPVTYEAEVKLPVGSRITRFAVSSNGGRLITTLYRQKLGGGTEPVATVGFTDFVGDGWFYAPEILLSRVAAGYKYWVEVYIEQGFPEVRGVKVSYN